MPRDSAWILDIVAAGRRALAFVDGIDFPEFEKDARLHSAVLYQLVVIGEAARRISDSFRAEHPEIPWPKIIALRNLVVHDYVKVSLDRIWAVMEKELPQLIAAIEPLLPQENE